MTPRRFAASAAGRAAPAAAALALAFAATVPSRGAAADGVVSALFAQADQALGERLIREHACDACHAKHMGGDTTFIYNPRGRIRSPEALRTMVEACNTQLGLQMFPEEVLAVAAVLDRDHYRFARRGAAR